MPRHLPKRDLELDVLVFASRQSRTKDTLADIFIQGNLHGLAVQRAACASFNLEYNVICIVGNIDRHLPSY